MAKAGKTKTKKAARALKVFWIPIGFHDAFVVVPLKTAALSAWGHRAQSVRALATDRRSMTERHDRDLAKLQQTVDQAQTKYRAKLAAYRSPPDPR